jgi:uncharacterized protein YndB with AHSA1/START domain
MLVKILLVLVALLAGLAMFIAVQPAAYTVERAITIAAPPATVFAQINDFHRWDLWSPWAKLDPNMKVTFDGSAAGAGAVYSWTGNDDVGAGTMTILESRPHESIRIKLDFLKPFESSADNEFRIAEDPAGAKVTWTISGRNNFLSKAYSLFMGGMDKAIGPDFEKGLRQLKSAAESAKT